MEIEPSSTQRRPPPKSTPREVRTVILPTQLPESAAAHPDATAARGLIRAWLREHPERLDAYAGNPRLIRLPRSFDVAFSSTALHWIKDQGPVLRGVSASLRSGGRLLFQMGGRGNGLGIFGAIAGGVLGLIIYTNWKKLNVLRWCDILAPGLILAQGIGRWGNFFNQELYGYPTNLPWGIYIDPAHRLPGFEQYSKGVEDAVAGNPILTDIKSRFFIAYLWQKEDDAL